MSAPTPAQTVARMRNWSIRNLRALYALSYQIQGSRGATIRALIDEELASKGAMTTGEQLASIAERWAKSAQHKGEQNG